MTMPFSAGCACGAIRYECNAEPTAMFNCHCRDCQQATSMAAAWMTELVSSANAHIHFGCATVGYY